jgi:hypothetical protein
MHRVSRVSIDEPIGSRTYFLHSLGLRAISPLAKRGGIGYPGLIAEVKGIRRTASRPNPGLSGVGDCF